MEDMLRNLTENFAAYMYSDDVNLKQMTNYSADFSPACSSSVRAEKIDLRTYQCVQK